MGGAVKSTAYVLGEEVHIRDIVLSVKDGRLSYRSITGSELWMTRKGPAIYLTDKASHDRLNG